MARSVYRSKDHADIIERLQGTKNPETDVSVFPTIKALQCFAAVLGFNEGRRIKLDRKNAENIEWHTFENGDYSHYIYLIALAETGDPNVLKFDIDGQGASEVDQNMFVIFEEYAEGGFEILRAWMNKTPSDPHGDRAILIAMEKSGLLQKETSVPKESEIIF